VRPKIYRDAAGFSEHAQELQLMAPDSQQWEYFDMVLALSSKKV
jgi:hypothetical protein